MPPNSTCQQSPTSSQSENVPYISVKQRLLNDWADSNIAPIMVQGKVVKRKRSGDNKENQNSKRSKSMQIAPKNVVNSEKPSVLQNVVENPNNLKNVVAQRTFKRRGSPQNLAEKKAVEKKQDEVQKVAPKKMAVNEYEPVVSEEFLMRLNPKDPLGLKLLI